jgi:hypothetical protein
MKTVTVLREIKGDQHKKNTLLFRVVLILPTDGSIISRRNFHEKCYLE